MTARTVQAAITRVTPCCDRIPASLHAAPAAPQMYDSALPTQCDSERQGGEKHREDTDG